MVVNNPLARPYFLGGLALGGGPPKISMISMDVFEFEDVGCKKHVLASWNHPSISLGGSSPFVSGLDNPHFFRHGKASWKRSNNHLKTWRVTPLSKWLVRGVGYTPFITRLALLRGQKWSPWLPPPLTSHGTIVELSNPLGMNHPYPEVTNWLILLEGSPRVSISTNG